MSYLEVELKFELDPAQIDNLIEKVIELGYSNQGRKYEKNTMYDNPQGLMQTTNGRVRLRVSWNHAEFCYKRPIKNDSGIKKEIEYETIVTNADATSKILNAMEFHEVSSYERYRTTLIHEKDQIKITIDEFPFASFMEVEGEESQIKEVASRLHFDMKDNLTKSCDTLFNERRKVHWLPETNVMDFKTFDT